MERMKKLALGTFIASVIISGILGIVAVLWQTWGEVQTRILLTTLTITGACLLLLCAAALRERRRAGVLPMAGTALALAGALLALGTIWRLFRGEAAERATFMVLTFAVVTALLCLLSMARLPGRFRWALWGSFVAWYVLAAKLSMMIATDSESPYDLRIVGVSSIVGGCLAILIPIFHRMTAARKEAAGSGRPKIYCPCCGIQMDGGTGILKCPGCRRSFTVEILASAGSPKPQS